MSTHSGQLKVWRLLLATILLLGFSTLTHSQEGAPDNTATQTLEPTTQTPTESIARAVFTSQIVDREPVDTLTELANDTERVYFFTDLRDMAGQILTHQWEYTGQIMAEVKFKVGSGPRWRVYSSKNLLPIWTGEWTVSVINENGENLNTSKFTYIPASTPETTTPTE